ncbi:hypothetical protein O1M63_41440 [Streptomyces mirabilis]|nr:hypothetical protein [Streptomyces mirabilis]
MTVRLAVAEDDVLFVDVEDPRPEFPDSTAAIEGEKGSGLMYVRLLRAQVTWSLSEDARTKTVQARLLPDTTLGTGPCSRRKTGPVSRAHVLDTEWLVSERFVSERFVTHHYRAG